jgi:hypothetical protein
MRAFQVLRLLVLNGVAVGLGATVATSCIKVNYPTVAFRCNPRLTDNCPETHFCCSDDPAAEGGALPDFMGRNIEGGATPYFAGQNNSIGTSGMCVNRDEIPFGAGLQEAAALNCPVPCNPTWDEDSVVAVCGEGRVCCQTVELEPEDCVLPDGSDEYRPVTGADIPELTNWTASSHATHQDPNGSGCALFAGSNSSENEVFTECVASLSVANQRGFCMSLDAGVLCPTAQAGYVDACTLRTQGGGAAPQTGG